MTPDPSAAPATPPVVQPCGDTALLVEVLDLHEVLALHAALESRRREGLFEGLVDAVPAARTLLLVAESPAHLTGVRDRLQHFLAEWAGQPPSPQGASQVETVRIPVHYNGPDLEAVAELIGLHPEEVVRAHTGSPWTVGFGGFAPGFSYLVGGDPRLQVPRREEPRTSVPAGAVGLAGAFSGIYPRPSPGGWQIIGETDVVLWDVERQPPALLQPGATVRFVDAGGDS